ncbi:hypothetical protein V7S43_002260 [Phytophthora oleae]|uniref:VWFA domain-containing protein n=1 Tax=Phytophthora oleae TaxID=2107226 RepID=A0ABD3G3B1_9STRA
MRRFSKLRSEMASNITKVKREMRRKYAMANTLELLIVIDCTASMNPWIEEAKSSIVSIIDGKKKDHPWVLWHVSTVRTFIASLRAFGGGDDPEDIPGGLAAALEMPFQAEAKRIVLVSDAPCHGSKFNDGGENMTYRVQIEQSPDICAQMREMAKRGIDFTFIEIQPTYTAKMVALLQEAFGSAEIQDGFEREFKTVQLSDASDVVRFASVVRSSASASIAASKGRSLISSSKIALGVSTYRHYGPTGRLTSRLPHVLEEEEESQEKAPVKATSGDRPEMKTLNWSEERQLSRD